MKTNRLKVLLTKYLDNSVSKEELAELLEQIKQLDSIILDTLLEEINLEDRLYSQGSAAQFNSENVFEKIKSQIEKEQQEKPIKFLFPYLKYASIAAIILCIFTIGYIWTLNSPNKNSAVISRNEIQLPDQNLAQITLQDGRTLSLLATEEKILKQEGIQLLTDSVDGPIFKINPNIAEDKAEIQTFISAKGTTSKLILADGSRVWLNSNSKLTYPSHFSSNKRQVALEGEAYFDVEHQNNKPFIVQANGTGIRVLGTEFNIATNHKSGKTSTTLISGSVEVNNASKTIRLIPGKQSLSQQFSKEINVREVDLKDIIAWKQGYFRFKDDDIETILIKIQEWYDIDSFEIKAHTSDRFSGSVIRTRKLSDLLDQLEKISNYKFQITAGRVIVMK